jgi:hypothetical protein
MANKFNLDKIRARLEKIPKEFDGLVAQIGIPKSAVYENGESVAYIASIQEFGAPAASIPPRPFFRPTTEEKKDEWVDVIKNLAPQVGEGRLTGFDVLDTVGKVAAIDIQTTIAGIYTPALSPITVLLRKWRKSGKVITGATVGAAAAAIAAGVDPGGDDKPLNSTGYMVASIRNAVAKEGSGFD